MENGVTEWREERERGKTNTKRQGERHQGHLWPLSSSNPLLSILSHPYFHPSRDTTLHPPLSLSPSISCFHLTLWSPQTTGRKWKKVKVLSPSRSLPAYFIGFILVVWPSPSFTVTFLPLLLSLTLGVHMPHLHAHAHTHTRTLRTHASPDARMHERTFSCSPYLSILKEYFQSSLNNSLCATHGSSLSERLKKLLSEICSLEPLDTQWKNNLHCITAPLSWGYSL